MNGSFSATIGANISRFMANMRRVQQQIRTAATDVEIDVNANTNGFARAIARVRARTRQLEEDHVVITIEARIQRFQATIGRIASNIRAFGELIEHTFVGLKTTLLPAIAPLISNIGVAIANLGPMIGVVAGQTLGLVGAFGAAGIAAVAFGAVAIPIIARLFDEEAKLNAEQAKAKKSFDDLATTFRNIQTLVQTPVLEAFTTAVQTLNIVLYQLRPLINNTANAFNGLMSELRTSIGTPEIQGFLQYLNETGAQFITIFGRSIGNIFKGLASLLTNIAPLSMFAAQGFENMSKSFATWTAGLSESKKFESFVAYTMTNLPKVKSIFVDLIAGLTYFFAAFGASSSGMMDGLVNLMARFKEFSSTLSENQGFQTFLSYVSQTAPQVLSLIGNLTTFLVNLGIGMAPVGSALIQLVNGFLSWFNGLLESNRAIGIVLASVISFGGVLLAVVPNVIALSSLFTGLGTSIMIAIGKAIPFAIGLLTNFSATIAPLTGVMATFGGTVKTVFLAITGPIGIAVLAITAFIAILVKMYKENEEFRAKVDKIWNSIKDIFSSVTTAITDFVVSMWSKITSFWNDNQENISSSTKTVWNAIQKVINFAMDAISAVFTAVWPIISGVVQIAWALIKAIVETGINFVLNIIKTVMAVLNGDWTTAWDGIKGIVTTSWQLIENFLEGVNLADIGKNIIAGLAKGITNGFDLVKGAISSLASNIKSWFEKDMIIKSPSRVMANSAQWVPAGVAKGIVDNLNPIEKASQAMAKAVNPDFSQTVKATDDLMNKAKQVASKSAKETQVEIKKIEEEYAQKREELVKKSTDAIAETKAKANDKEKSLNATQQRSITNNQVKTNDQLIKLEKEKANKIKEINDKSEKNRYDALKQYLDRNVQLEKLTTQEVASYWEYVTRTFKEGTDERIEAQIQFNKAIKDLTVEQFEKEKSYVDLMKRYKTLSLTQELKVYEDYIGKHKKGSEEQIYYQQKIEDTRVAIHERLLSLNAEFTDKIKQSQQAEIDGIAAINDKYKQAEDARYNSYQTALGLFDAIQEKEEVVGETLLINLHGQIVQMKNWADSMQALANKGINKGLLEELQAAGPSAAKELSALNNLTESQLNEYNMLWLQKSTIARNQAQIELKGLREDADKEIEQLKSTTATQLDQYKKDWIVQIKAIRNGTTGEFNPMISSLSQIGMDAMRGLAKGMRDQTDEVRKAAQEVSNVIDQTIRKNLQIKSPSRVTAKDGMYAGQGLVEGLNSTKSEVSKATRGLTEMMQNDLSAASLGLETSLSGGVNSNLVNSYEMTSGNDQVSLLKQIAGLIGKLNLTVELDGDIISEKVDQNRGYNYSALRNVRGY